MLKLNKILLLRLAVYGATTAVVFGVLLISKKNLEAQNNFRADLRKIKVDVPSTRPEVSQRSIDLAVEMYQIKIPAFTNHPKLDKQLNDRGITIKRAGNEYFEVFIGPSAFSSWGLLGSTLAHEIEIHANQSFLAIFFLEKLGFSATAEAERMAYDYELILADYFALSEYDRLSIAETRDYYYPLINGSQNVAQLSADKKIHSSQSSPIIKDNNPQSVLGRLAAALIMQK